MKKLMALVLSFGLVLLGAAPVMAESEATSNLDIVSPEASLVDEVELSVVLGGISYNSKLDYGKYTGDGGSGGSGGGLAVYIGWFAAGYVMKMGADAWDETKKVVSRTKKNLSDWSRQQREITRQIEQRERNRHNRNWWENK